MDKKEHDALEELCRCGHPKWSHDLSMPEGERGCLWGRYCTCENFSDLRAWVAKLDKERKEEKGGE